MGRFSIAAGALGLGFGLLACATPMPSSCVPIVEYSAGFQTRLRAEFDLLGPESTLRQAMIDFEAMRDAARACRQQGPVKGKL
jgi:hypothetical protein